MRDDVGQAAAFHVFHHDPKIAAKQERVDEIDCVLVRVRPRTAQRSTRVNAPMFLCLACFMTMISLIMRSFFGCFSTVRGVRLGLP